MPYSDNHPYARMSPITLLEDFPIGTLLYTTYPQGRVDEHRVDGYIFDGKQWFPAYDTWDGWCAYFGDEEAGMYQPETSKESAAVEEWLSMINEDDD